jgi:hypothetical protein
LDEVDIKMGGEMKYVWVERKICFVGGELVGVLEMDKKVCCGA